MHVIGREPVDLVRLAASSAIARPLTSSNVSVSARSARSSRTVPISRARPCPGQRENREEIGLVEIDVQFAVDRRPGGLDVGDVEHLPIGAAGKAGADGLAHHRARPVAAGEVGRLAILLVAVGPRSRARRRLACSVKLTSSVRRSTVTPSDFQLRDQKLFVLVLREDLQERVGRQPLADVVRGRDAPPVRP